MKVVMYSAVFQTWLTILMKNKYKYNINIIAGTTVENKGKLILNIDLPNKKMLITKLYTRSMTHDS